MKILFVEDDERLRQVVSKGLSEHGIHVTAAADYGEGRRLAVFERFDVLVLDAT